MIADESVILEEVLQSLFDRRSDHPAGLEIHGHWPSRILLPFVGDFIPECLPCGGAPWPPFEAIARSGALDEVEWELLQSKVLQCLERILRAKAATGGGKFRSFRTGLRSLKVRLSRDGRFDAFDHPQGACISYLLQAAGERVALWVAISSALRICLEDSLDLPWVITQLRILDNDIASGVISYLRECQSQVVVVAPPRRLQKAGLAPNQVVGSTNA